jgi:hypothetical protein
MLQEAKRIFRSIKHHNWRSIIAKMFPELEPDLIARLNDPPELSDDLLATLAEKGGTSTPSDIALEQAARKCGAPPYQYKVTTLRTLNAKQAKALSKD